MSDAGIRATFFGIMLNGLVAAFLRIRCGHRLRSTQPDLGVFLSAGPRRQTAAADPHSSKAARASHRTALEANCRTDPVPFVT